MKGALENVIYKKKLREGKAHLGKQWERTQKIKTSQLEVIKLKIQLCSEETENELLGRIV